MRLPPTVCDSISPAEHPGIELVLEPVDLENMQTVTTETKINTKTATNTVTEMPLKIESTTIPVMLTQLETNTETRTLPSTLVVNSMHLKPCIMKFAGYSGRGISFP